MAFLRARLLEQRSRLIKTLHSNLYMSARPAIPVPEDLADMASDSMEMETSFQMGSVESRAVAQIDEALGKIDAGAYGICEECGKAIPLPRLRALPFASLCIRCQQDAERSGEGDVFGAASSPFEEVESLPEGDREALENAIGRLRGRTRF